MFTENAKTNVKANENPFIPVSKKSGRKTDKDREARRERFISKVETMRERFIELSGEKQQEFLAYFRGAVETLSDTRCKNLFTDIELILKDEAKIPPTGTKAQKQAA